MAKAKTTVRKPTHEEFVFRLRDPSASYSFSFQTMKQDRDAFWEHQDVICVGECLYPDCFKGRDAKVRLSGNRDLMNVTARESGSWKPTAIGYMDAGKSKFEVSISLRRKPPGVRSVSRLSLSRTGSTTLKPVAGFRSIQPSLTA